MFEKLLEKPDFKKYNLPAAGVEQLGIFLEKDEFVEIGVTNQSLLGIKKQAGKEVVHTTFNIHVNKSSLMEMVRSKLGNNFKSNKKIVNKKIESINQKLKKIHDRLQGVFIVFSSIIDILNSFDTKKAVFACKTVCDENIDEIMWIKDVKKASLLILCPDTKHHHTFLTKYGCSKMKIGRTKNKNIWLRQP